MPRQPGTPKTGGRVAGTPNKATADVKALAGNYTASALATLAEIMQDAGFTILMTTASRHASLVNNNTPTNEPHLMRLFCV